MDPRYRFTTLTAAIRDPGSPLREYLLARFPHVAPLQADYRRGAGGLLVPGGSSDAATIGTALDLQVRFLLDPGYVPREALYGFAGRPACLRALAGVAERASAAARAEPAGVGDSRSLARACWALALSTAVYRSGLQDESRLAWLLRGGRFTARDLLADAPADGVRELVALREVAERDLLAHLRPPFALGPTFDDSEWCAADADLIADGLLLEIKTRLGRLRPDGSRADGLSALDVYQLLAYALFDHSDAYRIDRVGLYSARYGSLHSWALPDVLATLAGAPVDLTAAREDVWRIVSGQR